MVSAAVAALSVASLAVTGYAEESRPAAEAAPSAAPSAQPAPSTQTPSTQAPSGQTPDVSLPAVSVQRPDRPKVRARKKRPAKRVAAPVRVEPAPAPRVARPESGLGPVQGYAARQSVTGTKTDTPIIAVPQSISVITRDQIVAQQAQSVPEIVRYTPGVTTEFYGASSFLDEIKVRGFVAPRFLDGLRLPTDTVVQFAQPKTEPYGLERFEILKGPSSGIYGQTSPGGLVNMVSKRPTDFHRGEVALQTGSFGRLQGAFDLSGPLDEQRKFLGRIVGLARDTDRVIDFNHEERLFIAPSFTWLPTPDTTFTFLSSYLHDDIKGQPQQYLPAYGTLYLNPNGRIPYSRNIGEPDYDRVKLDQVLVGYAFTHRFNEVFEVRQNLRYGTVRNEVYSMRNETDLLNPPAPPGQAVTLRSANYVFGEAKNLAVDTHVQADFLTGPLVHKVLFGIDYQKQDVTADYRSFPPFPLPPAFPINVFAPVYGQPIPGKDGLSPVINTVTDQYQLGFYLQDQIKVDRWVLTLTGRHDKAVAETTNLLTDTIVNQDDSAFTGRAGLTYLFDNGVAPYVSYATSFQPVFGFSVADANGQPFKPTTGEGWEAGIKYQPPGYRMLLTAAVFEITQQNVLSFNPATFSNTQVGEVKVRGVELEARGNVTRELALVGGVSHIEPIVTKSADPANIGNDLNAVPRDHAALWAMYTCYDGSLGGLSFGAGVRYVGSLFGDEANRIRVPSHTLFDAVVSYDFGYLRPDMKGLTLQINATNLFNKYYVANCFTGLAYCALGAPRTVLATLRYRWQEAEREAPRIVKARY